MARLPIRFPVVLLVAILGITSPVPWSWADPPRSKRYAFLVGINEYDHNKFKPLAYSENDVTDLAGLLGKGGYEVTLLTGSRGKSKPDLQPTRANILSKLTDLLDRCKRNDTVLIGLSGHGIQFDKQQDSYFCPSDAQPTDLDSLVSLGDLYQQLDDSGAGAKLVLVDACREDPVQGGSRGIDGDNARRPPSGVAVFFSCSSGQRAFEHDRLKHGVFFHYILEGLRGAARNEDNQVDWSSLTGYVSKKVTRLVPRLLGGGAKQAPNLVADLSGEPPVLLSYRGSSSKPVAPEVKKDAPYIKNAVGMELLLIPAGSFLMGSPKTEEGRFDDEDQHRVDITRPYYLGKSEVTVGQFQAFVRESGYRTESENGKGKKQVSNHSWMSPGFEQGEDHPVVNVSWNDAMAFCSWLSKKEGYTYRLPTEAEWEYGCRAKKTTRYYWGNEVESLVNTDNVAGATFLRQVASRTAAALEDAFGSTLAVDSFRPNGFGLKGMHGNASEWCADWYNKDYYKNGPREDPQGPRTGVERVVRGGSYNLGPRFCRSAFRNRRVAAGFQSDLGFRVVRVR